MESFKGKNNMIRILMGILAFFALLMVALGASADTVKSSHFLYEQPKSEQNETVMVRYNYAMSYNAETKFPNWVAYKVALGSILGNNTLERKWRSDPDIHPDSVLEESDFSNISILGMDRGHLIPISNFKNTLHGDELSYLSTVVPMNSNLNRKVWYQLEDAIANSVDRDFDLFVITGPVYVDNSMPKLPKANEKHIIPNGFWKIVYYEANGVLNINSFVMMQNVEIELDLCKTKTSLLIVEQLTGYKFFTYTDGLNYRNVYGEKNEQLDFLHVCE